MGKRNITNRLVLLALGLAPTVAFGAGLGKLTVLSGLGQPLRAEIEIVALQKGELETLTARLAPVQAFREANIEYSSIMSSLNFNVDRRGGRPVVVVTSAQPVEDPFLDLLVELNWQSGRLVREYTFLLDPAEYKGPQAITAPAPAPAAPPVAAQPVAPPPQVAERAVPAPAPAPRAIPSPSTAPAPAASGSSAPGTYTVKPGDTLSKVAAANLPEGVTMQQMLVALYRANEDAFINKNMNLVKSGRTLVIPDKAAAQAVAPEDANKVVIAQTQDFNEYRAKVGQAVAAAAAKTAEPSQRASGRVTAKVEDSAPAPAAAPSDQLRLSKPESGQAAGAADDASARDKAAAEAKERIAALEKNVQDLQQLVEMKNKQLSELQKQAEQGKAPVAPAPAPKAAEPAKPAEPPKPADPPKAAEAPMPAETAKAPEPAKPAEPKPAEAPKAEAPAPTPAPAPSAEAPKPEAAAAPAPSPAPAPAPTAEAPKPKPKVVAPPPPPEPSFVDELLDNPVALGGGAAGLLALLGLGAYVARRRRSAKLENSLLGVTQSDTSSVFGTTGGRNVDTGASSLQTDFSQSGLGAIDTDEVDPVAEADVYMAYGRDAQAEEILKEALQKDPNRQSVRVKLLEIYASRKDLKAFETTAGELYAATGGQGPEWDKACQLGLSIDPTNPMYGGKGADPSSTLPPGTVILPGAAAAAVAAAPAPEPDIALDVASQEPPALDFDLGGTPSVKPAAADITLDVGTPSQLPSDLGFDLNLGEPSQAQAEEASDFSPSGTFIMDAATKRAVSEMDAAQTAPPDLQIDFELPGTKADAGFDQTAKMQVSQANVLDFDLGGGKAAAGKSQPVDVASISFDLGEPSTQAPAVDSRWQEVATKLDLAKAYEEMGDKDGARELLNEVVKEGDNAQQQQAKTLLAAMG